MQKSLSLDQMKSLPREEQDEIYKRLKKIRKKYKPVNYSAIYGIGSPKLSRELGCSKQEAQSLLDAYWKRNWSVRRLVGALETKEAGGYVWLKNPVSGFWYELRFDKDRFSTLNQGTGVYVFDSWLARVKTLCYMGVAQFHDETVGLSELGKREETLSKLKGGVSKLNQQLRLNVKVDIDAKFGRSYADVH